MMSDDTTLTLEKCVITEMNMGFYTHDWMIDFYYGHSLIAQEGYLGEYYLWVDGRYAWQM